MRLHWLVQACSTAAFAQSFEASFSGGQTVIPAKNASIGTYSSDPNSGTYKLNDGFRISLRMTLNQWRFMGHEFGYAYNHTSVEQPPITGIIGGGTVPVQPGSPSVGTTAPANIGVPAHQGFYNFLLYAAPEGFRVRP